MVGWLVGWLVSWLVGWSVGWLVGWLVGCLVGWSVVWLVGWLVGWLVVFIGPIFFIDPTNSFFCRSSSVNWTRRAREVRGWTCFMCNAVRVQRVTTRSPARPSAGWGGSVRRLGGIHAEMGPICFLKIDQKKSSSVD